MSQDERNCLAHVVIDPDAWYQNVLNTFGQARAESMLAAKVERWWDVWKQESAKPDYKTRAQREVNAAQAVKE